jgi:hypothetical protein
MNPTKLSWWRRSSVAVPAAVLVTGMLIACGAGGAGDTGAVAPAGDAAVAGDAPTADTETPDGLYKFGQTVKFNDGSTLTVGKPVKFKRAQYAAGGENAKVYLKFKSTFKNNTKEIFDPALTSGSASAGGEEAEAVYQDGLDAPDNKVLPGKSVTWSMGYGFATGKDVQLEVNVGFLDYGTVIFTS